MNSDLLFDQYCDDDLTEQFSDYTVSDLRSNLLKLLQTNMIYYYCESLIIEDRCCNKQEIGTILGFDQDSDHHITCDKLPFELLIELKSIKDKIKINNWEREQIIELILNLIVENTLIHSTLRKFTWD
ncbi:hypothetical protein I4641_12200 [Waterburya agarophytonicola K14]|uniref:Uncharacterized protein n=1 Tax=Waterburya agarophytonicola KI4 TaxID=2874699 RepID=A0A964BRY1_9CYAN|nr:hypothetical protein [Waterburya agarophytonicola]MCC0177741.1 hypothetical protein [Waterburya agarophytonicola KI4]